MDASAIETLEALDTIRPYWESVQRHPNTDFEHYRLVCARRAPSVRPYVVVMGPPECPAALLVCRLEHRPIVPRVGYVRTVALPAVVLTVLHEGLLGGTDEPVMAALFEYLWGALGSGQADAVEFSHVREASPLLTRFLAGGPRFWSDRNVSWSRHWSARVPDHVGGLLEGISAKHRKWMRKKERELGDAFPGGVAWRWLRSFPDLPDLCTRLEAVAAGTYQRGLGAGFRNDAENAEQWRLFASRDQLRLQLLEINGEPRAFWSGLIYQGVFHSWATAYDPRLAHHEPGNLLFHRMVDELTREGVKTLDFGLGDAFYKQRFGDQSWNETTVRLFAPTPRGALLRANVGFSTGIDRAGRRLLETTGLTSRLKGLWRRRLARPADRTDAAQDSADDVR